MDLIIATGNQGKLKELRELLADCPANLHSLAEYDAPLPVEDGHSFVENALIKARAAAKLANMPAMADDSGLLVDALGGAPGLYSARFAPPDSVVGGQQDQANNHRLLAELANTPPNERSAHFHCTAVLLRHAHDPQPLIAMADWHGIIAERETGDGGFGYDPLFIPRGLSKSSAQLEPGHKNAISHRGQAIAQLVAQLRNDFGWN